MPTLGGWEIALIALILLIIFGAGKLPSAIGGLGRSIKEFRDELKGVEEHDKPA
jgi:sec-independent protein translocase protein TatA